jgi:hypothetical protein
MNDLPIVVIAYNRPAQLARLLHSIQRSLDIVDHRAKVIVSVDSGTPACVEVCRSFSGMDIDVLARPQRLGLKKHVIACGDMLAELGAAMFLEDDLLVTPAALTFAAQGLPVARAQKRVAALSLYSFHFNEFAFDWLPRQDVRGDVFYAQTSSSWGQVWWREPWEQFRQWMEQETESRIARASIPTEIKQWPAASWKRTHNAFIAEKRLFSMIPTYSFVFNCGSKGSHHAGGQNIAFSELALLPGKTYRIDPLDDAVQLDAFLELLNVPEMRQFSFSGVRMCDVDFDIFGKKGRADLKREYVLTSRRHNREATLASFSASLGNQLAGALLGIEGEGLWLVPVSRFDAAAPIYSELRYRRDRIAAIGDATLVRLAIDAIARKMRPRFLHG